MSDCCTSNRDKKYSQKQHTCPQNGKLYHDVPFRTLLHHVKQPWKLSLKNQSYYFCDDPHCDVVYFGRDNMCINKSMIRTSLGAKEPGDETIICFCFGITETQAFADKNTKAFVIEQTKNGRCSCETSNLSGRCCLKDFPK